jgi:CubicO group peptidase (beta-lactamase class C family)
MAEAPGEGFVAPGFERVREAFAENFTQHGEVGAGVAVHVGGELVVDLWGGTADVQTGTPYTKDTLQLVFSTTKGATAVCANLLIQRGQLDPNAPVAEYWPEFARAGKADVPVIDLLCHRVGLPVVDGEVPLDDVLSWDPVCARLAAQKPVWEPGTAHGYHAITFGNLVGEVVRRVSGKSLGTFFADEVAAPLGLEFWIGLPEEHESRVAPLIPVDLPTDPSCSR